MKEKEIHVPFLLAGGDVNWVPHKGDGSSLPSKLRLVSTHRSPRAICPVELVLLEVKTRNKE